VTGIPQTGSLSAEPPVSGAVATLLQQPAVAADGEGGSSGSSALSAEQQDASPTCKWARWAWSCATLASLA